MRIMDFKQTDVDWLLLICSAGVPLRVLELYSYLATVKCNVIFQCRKHISGQPENGANNITEIALQIPVHSTKY